MTGDEAFFLRMWQGMPNLNEPPHGPRFMGDFCKINDNLWVFDGQSWKEWSDQPTYVVQAPAAPSLEETSGPHRSAPKAG